MKTQRLLAFAVLALTAACAGGIDSPVEPTADAAVAPATVTNPFFNVTVSPASAFFVTPNANTVPTGTKKIVFRSQYSAFATLGPPRIVRIDFVSGGQGGWLTGQVSLKSASQADLDLRVIRGLPLGAYRANVILTLAGAVTFTVPVTFVSGMYFIDNANSATNWTFTGLWHLAAGNNCVSFRGCTPLPTEGTGFFWYGSEATGDFNFGTNSGTATGPAFAIPAGAISPLVMVKTWFEIEFDVSPFSFDFMDFYLVEAANPGNSVFVGRINGSAGFNSGNSFTAPGGPWLSFSAPVPPAAFGNTWQLQLRFATGDPIANNYRGWGVDEIIVIESGGISPNLVAPRMRSGVSQAQTGRPFELSTAQTPFGKRN